MIIKLSDKEFNDVCRKLFLRFAWGKTDEAIDLLERHLADEAEDPERIEDLLEHERQGRKAFDLAKALKVKIDKGRAPKAIGKWLKNERIGLLVSKHLEIEWKKHRERKASYTRRSRQARGFKVSLPEIELNGDRHPHSLRNLTPSAEWTVLVDETGSVFNLSARGLNERDKTLGRAVALLVPGAAKLSPAPEGFHASKATDPEVEQVIKTLLAFPIGVLGGTFQRDLAADNWLDGIRQLVFWTLLMLPVDRKTRVRVLVENRDVYTTSTDGRNLLEAMRDVVLSRLARLSPDRASRINLSVEVMDKRHPHNGYVDAIANLWGSPARERKKMLKHCRWVGQCLHESSHMGHAERLYLRLGYSVEQPDPADWFELCQLASEEPRHSLLHELLKRLGAQACSDRDFWMACLFEVQHRIASKTYAPDHLAKALDWLEAYRSGGHELPGALLLRLGSARLAADNHLGRSDPTQVIALLKQARSLKDEVPGEACEVVLRMAISATNVFDFESARPFIEQWLSEPVAVPGLLNHGKLHSTLGQLDAFQAHFGEALQSFDRALQSFESLSDAAQARREIMQTSLYRHLVAIDAGESGAIDAGVLFLCDATGVKRKRLVAQLARSGQQWRFLHHFVLRMLVTRPIDDKDCQVYLATEKEWQHGDGHPWMLIEAYRGWLQLRAGNTDAATDAFAEAIAGCIEDEESVILQWMGRCLVALGQSLGLPLETLAGGELPNSDALPLDALAQLAAATSDDQRQRLLQVILPFNFH